MTSIAIGRPSAGMSAGRMSKIIILLAALFFLLLGYTSYVINRGVQEVPLKPCKRCTTGCPCPRLSGSIRCGCPD